MDIFIKTSNEEENYNVLQKLGKIFTDLGMKNVNILSETKTNVRLCKFFDEKENINVDISANFNNLSKNLQLFQIYTQIDKRFKILALIIKYWAKQRYIDRGDVVERMINSYSYILLLIFFLQIQQPPILPSSESLQDIIDRMNEQSIKQQKYKHIEELREEEESYLSSIKTTSVLLSNFDSNLNSKSIGELLIEFFEYYGFEFQYSEYVISPRKGQLLTKKEKNWEKCLMAIEDPIICELNKGGILFPWCFEGIINEFKLTFVKLTEYQMDFFHDICQPVKEINYLPPLACPPVDDNYKRKILEDYVRSLKE